MAVMKVGYILHRIINLIVRAILFFKRVRVKREAETETVRAELWASVER